MTIKQRHKLYDKFYFDKDTGLPDLNNYGKYRLGLTPSSAVFRFIV